MTRLHAVFLVSLVALLAMLGLSLLVAAGAQAAPLPAVGVAGSFFDVPARNDPLSGDASLAYQAPLSCTYSVTTTSSIVTNNFSFGTARDLLPPLDPLSLLPSSYPVPPGTQVTLTVETQYFRLDALQNFHYLIDAIPNTGSTYNLRIVVYNASQTAILTSVKPLSVLSASVDFVPPSTGLYYVAISHIGGNCPSASSTYRITLDGPATSTPTQTRTPTPTGSATPTGATATGITGGDRFEPNFDFDRAALIALDEKFTNLNFVPWSGSDPYQPDNDFFKVWVKPGELVTCETLDLSAYTDTNLIIYDNNRNGLGGNQDIDRANSNLASRVRYYATYEGWLYVLIGNEYPIEDPTLAFNFTYSLQCSLGFGPTSTPTDTRVPVTPPTPIPSRTPSPTTIPSDTPTFTPTPPFIQVVPLPTITPQGRSPQVLVPIHLQVYYDRDNDRVPDQGEGIVGISARVIDVETGQELVHAFTDEFGFASLTVNASGVVRLVVPYLNYSILVQPSGNSIDLHIAASALPNTIP